MWRQEDSSIVSHCHVHKELILLFLTLYAQVVVSHKRPSYFHLSRSLKKLGRIVGRGNRPSIAKTVLNDPPLTTAILANVVARMKREMKKLCSLNFSSIHQWTDFASLKSFSWEKVVEELVAHAPTLHAIVDGCIPRGDEARRNAIIGIVVSIFLKARNRSMCAVQTVLSLIFHEGHTAKQVSQV